MELTMADLASKKPTAAGPIATPAPGFRGCDRRTGAFCAAECSTAIARERHAETVSVEGPKSEIRGQPTGAANPASAPPGTQPGASATPAASPPSGAAQPNPGGKPVPTPVQSPAGSPLPVAGKTPTP